MASLGVKIRQRDTVPETFTVPALKKKMLAKPVSFSTAYKPEPTLDEETYREILRIIYNTGVEIERHPSLYKSKNEESLRDILIMGLASHYENVTGETFNKNGKTDILVRHEGSNVFVAECKFWRGQKEYFEAIDQLLSYLTWRDPKTALIIFVTSQQLEPVHKTIKTDTPKYRNYVLARPQQNEGQFLYEFHLLNDPSRGVLTTIYCFHLPGI